ncbi:copper chaperone PCu(A)C [Sandarakinorhabdus sp. DWP1-3-1]|uniref:copper chaperone PCu(A)C n=1 Tax=Sandarakinorhabdus sp. DWP1-3-1 TaxID=2804627 RepID=UPI003CECA4BB
MRTPIAYALLAFAAPGLAAPARQATTTAPVKEAWDKTAPRATAATVRLNPVPGRPSAGYLTITGGGQPDRLIGATAPGARIEMHSMTMAGGIMSMAKLDAVPVPAGAAVSFAPGGNHLMIFGLSAPIKTLPITLAFGSGKKVTVTAKVQPVGDAAHAGH